MKKIICLVMIFVISSMMSLTVSAGDIPETLLNDDNAQIFVAVVENYALEKLEGNDYLSVASITVKPTRKIKGDINVGFSIMYTKSNFGSFVPTLGEEYLFGYVDENNFYIYELNEPAIYDPNEKVTPTPSDSNSENIFVPSDTSDISLKNATDDSQTERLQAYLSDNSFVTAEKERLAEVKTITLAELIGVDKKTANTVRIDSAEVDKDKFYEIADKITLLDITNTTSASAVNVFPKGFHIEVNGLEGYAFIAEEGWVAKHGAHMSSTPSAEYQITFSDYEALRALAAGTQPETVSTEKNKAEESAEESAASASPFPLTLTAVIVVVFALAAVAAVLIAIKVKKNKK